MIYVVIAVLIVIALAIVYLILSAPRRESQRPGMEKLYVNYAHRGLWGGDIPENSIPAFAAAVNRGYGIELDVQLSSDGDVMVFHDYTLSRMCGEDVRLSSLRGAELSWRHLGGTEYTIPLLSDVLDTVRGRVPLLIELKGETSDTALCEAVARILGHYDGKVCVESFNPYLLGWFKKHQPKIARGVLYTDFSQNPTTGKLVNFMLGTMMTNVISRPDFVAADGRFLNKIPLRMMRSMYKLPTFVWTVRNKDVFASARSKKLKSIFEQFDPEAQ